MDIPKPIPTEDVRLPEELLALGERLAANTHQVWAWKRIAQGWRRGERRDDREKTSPCLVPYEQLPEEEKDYDRATSLELLRLIVKLGYRITREAPPE